MSDLAPLQLPLNKSESNSLEQNDLGSNIEEDLMRKLVGARAVICPRVNKVRDVPLHTGGKVRKKDRSSSVPLPRRIFVHSFHH